MSPTKEKPTLGRSYRSKTFVGPIFSELELGRFIHFQYKRLLNRNIYNLSTNLLYDEDIILILNYQQTSGADLALLKLEVLEKSKSEPTEHHIKRIANLFSLLSSGIPERHQYLIRAVKWSVRDQHKLGHPSLHQLLAQILWKEKNYGSARYHYLRSEDGGGCAHMLVELHLLGGYPGEADIFLTQAVLQFSCLCIKGAICVSYINYRQSLCSIFHLRPYIFPVFSSIHMLFAGAQGGSVSQFTVLCEQYQMSLKRDPTYREYLDRIGQLFFNLPPPRPQQGPGGLFGNLLQGLLGGLGDDDSDDETPTTGSSSGISSSKSTSQRGLAAQDLD
ncbi:unnamed protein product, partial [Meganyctiphanes norvegica]